MKNTKRIGAIILFAALILSLTSCRDSLTQEEHNEILSEVTKMQIQKDDSLEKMFVATLDEIDGNLDAIRDKQGILILGPGSSAGKGISKKEQILTNIAIINGLLEKNKSKIAALEKNISQYKANKKEVLHSIKIAMEKVATQQNEIESLKIKLAEKDFKIEDLNKTLAAREIELEKSSAQILEQENKLNRTYFVAGTYKELRNKHILEKEGGLLGIGRVKAISKSLNKEDFSTIDMFKTTTIKLEGKKPKIITKHPDGTFKIEKKEGGLAVLTINDPENFWRISKYLIVEVH